MLRTAARLIAAPAATVTLTLVVGAAPAHAATPTVVDGTTGMLCKILKISCP